MSLLKRLSVFFLTTVTLFTMCSVFFAEEDEEKKKFDVSAPFAMILNADTGTVLFEKNADTPFFCGFLPRLMTCVMLLESGLDLNTEIVLTKSMLSTPHDQSSANLRSGDKISLYDLMQCIIVGNSQEAALVVATTVGGSTADFIMNMNRRAQELGANSTFFSNVTGQYSATQETTVRDAAKICRHALTLDYIEEISNYRYAEISVNGHTKQIFTKNAMIDKNSSYYDKKASGLAISGSSTSGYSLVSVAEDKTIRLISFASTYDTIASLYADVSAMITHSLEEYSTRTLIQKSEPVCEVPVIFGKERDYLTLVAETSVSTSLPSDVSDDEIQMQIVSPEEIEAPIAKGTVYGTITYEYDGHICGQTNIVAQSGISIDVVASYTDKINGFFRNKYVIAAIVTVFVIVGGYSVILIISSRKQRKLRESRKREKLNKSPK